jgi:iron(III) transport system permease protein
MMMVLVLYPYVYLLARTALREHGAAALETARSLGQAPWRAFITVTVPLARPALVAGMALAMMEALADFGTVATFGYRTMTEAIYRVWYGMFDRTAATQLASGLLLFVVLLLSLERCWRGRARFTHMPRRGPEVIPTRLRGWQAVLASGFCMAVLGLAFVLPVGQLLLWAYTAWRAGHVAPHFVTLIGNTMWLATAASLGVCLLAVFFAYTNRLVPAPQIRLAVDMVSMGYALPGSVIAVGVLLPLTALDHLLAPYLTTLLGRAVGMVFTGSAVGLLFAYSVRFLAVSLQTVQASLAKIPPSLDDAARSLGVGVGGTLWRVHIPLLRSGVLTALILVFVEVMKEMPATLLLRPFGLDTLAVEVWQRTSEAMWQEAALPALTIVAAGIIPVFFAIRLSAPRTKRHEANSAFPAVRT